MEENLRILTHFRRQAFMETRAIMNGHVTVLQVVEFFQRKLTVEFEITII